VSSGSANSSQGGSSANPIANPVGDFEPSAEVYASAINPGGVLIDQAATLIGQDINSIAGATSPSKVLVLPLFLGLSFG
jgi:hypothetical protein